MILCNIILKNVTLSSSMKIAPESISHVSRTLLTTRIRTSWIYLATTFTLALFPSILFGALQFLLKCPILPQFQYSNRLFFALISIISTIISSSVHIQFSTRSRSDTKVLPASFFFKGWITYIFKFQSPSCKKLN